MPRLLKKDTIRFLESTIEFLSLAQLGICQHRRDQLKVENVRYSAEIGLIGSAIELSMSSVLIQAFGQSSIIKPGADRYKTAGEILSDFKKLLKDSPPVISFLTNGISNKPDHLKKLLDATLKFKVIITARANGFHAGIGTSFEVISTAFNDVTYFLELLSESNNYKPYLNFIPELIGIQKPPEVLIEDLLSKIKTEKDSNNQKFLLTSLLLVLPEIPESAPDWLEKFEEFQTKPRKGTFSLLVNTLDQAIPVSFMKTKSDESTIPVFIDESNPDSLPIAPHYLRTEIKKIHEQWYSESGLATGKLNSKILDLPHEKTLYTVFTMGFNETGVLKTDQKFKGQRVWSFIVSALNVSKNGNTAPFWFIIRNTEDFGQLKAQLNKAKKLANATVKDNINNVIHGVESIETGSKVSSKREFYKQLVELQGVFDQNIEKLPSYKNQSLKYPLSESHCNMIDQIIEGDLHVGDLLSEVLKEDSTSNEHKNYWTNKLSMVCSEIEDAPAILSVLNSEDLQQTWAKKAFRLIDFKLHGPKIE